MDVKLMAELLQFTAPVNPLEVITVAPGQIHSYWPFVSYGISDVWAEGFTDWIPEDVYARIAAGAAELLIFKKGERMVAFVVGYTFKEQYTGRLDYVIWITWSIPLGDRIPSDEPVKTRAEVIDIMKHRARGLKCKNLVLFSPRGGWEKLGFNPGNTEYRMEV